VRRTDTHLRAPDDVVGFPRRGVPTGQTMYRAHEARNDDGTTRLPWWFASAPADPDTGGRFDLPAPRGTCHMAFDPETALRERFGPELAEHKVLTAAAVNKTTLSRLELPGDVDAADTGATQAANWITRELVTTGDYALTQQWAAAFADDGAGGVLYESRFTTVPETNALALFGDAGRRDWPVEGTEDVRGTLGKAGIEIVPGARPLASFTKAAKRPPLSR
jgi:hypothetical protein